MNILLNLLKVLSLLRGLNCSSSESFDREGLQSDCNLKCAFSRNPRHLRKLVFPFSLVGRDTAVILLVISLGIWQHPSYHFILKNLLCRSCDHTSLYAKTNFEVDLNYFFPILKNFCCVFPCCDVVNEMQAGAFPCPRAELTSP